jgi:Fe-S-cluster containining protein
MTAPRTFFLQETAARPASSDTNPPLLAGQKIQITPLRRKPRSRLNNGDHAANDATSYNPCLSCGACCAHFRVSFYCGEIKGEGGGTVPAELVSQVGPLRACMKGTEYGKARCIALRGELGQDGIHCAIYEQRPSPCREFTTWMADGSPNPDCQRLRLALGLPPLAPLPNDGGDDQDPFNTPPRRDDIAA